MKKLILILLLLLPSQLWAATITAVNGGGNWSAGGTWVGGTVPDPATDTAVIPAALTAPVVLDDSRTIPATTIEDEVYGLAQGTGVVTTLGGHLAVGNGSGKDGAFTFGAGSTLNHNGYNFVQNNYKLRSNSTSTNWAIVTGTGDWLKGASYSAPKIDVILRYVSIQNAGVLTIPVGSSTSGAAGLTNQLDIEHCTILSTGAVTFGVAGWTEPSTKMAVNYSDFRNTGGILFSGIYYGGVSGARSFSYNTLISSAYTLIKFQAGDGTQFIGNSMLGYAPLGAHLGGDINLYGNYFEALDTGGNILVSGNFPANIVKSNYLYCSNANPHPFEDSGPTGTGTALYEYNVFETVYNNDTANLIMVGVRQTIIRNNLSIGGRANLSNNVGAKTGTQIDIYNNTSFNSSLWLTESGPYTGTINVHNNIVVYDPAAELYAVQGIGGVTQPLSLVGQNSWYNVTGRYNLVTFDTDQTALDVTLAGNPFRDSSRNLGSWGLLIGADGTVAGARTKLMAINGYNSTTKTQSDTPSGVTISGTSTSLVDWVAAGFELQLGSPAALMMGF